MTTAAQKPRKHTLAEWLALPEEVRVELIDGDFVPETAPGPAHSRAQAAVVGSLWAPFFQGEPGGRFPGGWWFLTEPDLLLGDDVLRPDVAGWRRERVPEFPAERPITVRPDWICEVLSESNRANDEFRKMRLYHQAGLHHYWVLDPTYGTLSVFRHEPSGYRSVLFAERHEIVRAEPFEALEIRVGLLLGERP